MSARLPLVLDGSALSVADVARVARDPGARVEVAAEALERVRRGRLQIESLVARYRDSYAAFAGGERRRPPVQEYGLTTGFGEFKDIPVAPDELDELQRNLLRSHAAGVGAGHDADDPPSYFDAEVVRATILIRLNAFLGGHSGVRVELLETLVAMLHRGIVPLVPIRGSLGSSGDLCPLAHLFAVLLGEGRYRVVERKEDLDRWASPPRPASALPDDLGCEPALPGVKESLALLNGATASTALLALAVHDAEGLASSADVAVALSLEATCGCARAFDPQVHEARHHPGQIASAAAVRELVAGSRLVDAAATAVQDPYSTRCAPAVHGASRDAIAYARSVVERELNAATDNPLFFTGEPWDAAFKGNWPPRYDGTARASYSAGNFHGQPIAVAADVLAIAVAELADISERRTQRLLDRHHNRNLPANLIARRGTQSGLMIAQYSAASLVSENKVLCHPASVDSIPTAANIEDHVAMATVAARKARTVVGNAQAVLAVELMCAAQAVEWRVGLDLPPEPVADRRPVEPADGAEAVTAEAQRFADAVQDRDAIAARLGRGTAAAYREIRRHVEPLVDDRVLATDIRRLRRAVAAGGFVG